MHVACPPGFGLDRKAYDKTQKQRSRSAIHTVSSQPRCYALTSDGKPFALIDLKTTKSLKLAEESAPLQLQVVIAPRCLDTTESRASALKPSSFSASLNVYTTEKHAKTIGAILAKEKRYLQHPYEIDDGVQYNNPQYLHTRDRQNSMNSLIRGPQSLAERLLDISTQVSEIMNDLGTVRADNTTLSELTKTPLMR